MENNEKSLIDINWEKMYNEFVNTLLYKRITLGNYMMYTKWLKNQIKLHLENVLSSDKVELLKIAGFLSNGDEFDSKMDALLHELIIGSLDAQKDISKQREKYGYIYNKRLLSKQDKEQSNKKK